jgi:hypothetical protein
MGRPFVRRGDCLWALLAFGTLLVCSGCGASAGSQPHLADAARTTRQAACLYGLEASGDSVALAREQSHSRAACARIPQLCRWIIGFSQFRTHTAPGTFVDRPPGSCPHSELESVLRLAAGIRLSGLRGTGLCQFLPPDVRARTQNLASVKGVSCEEIALGGVSYRQLSQPLSYIILSPFDPGRHTGSATSDSPIRS